MKDEKHYTRRINSLRYRPADHKVYGPAHYRYFEAVAGFLQEPSSEEREACVIEKLAELDQNELDGEDESFKEAVRSILRRLRDGEREEWTEMLTFAATERIGDLFQKLKSFSPFASRLVIVVGYGAGWGPCLYGDVEGFLEKLIGEEKGFKVWDCDTYLTTFPMPDLKEAEVFWMRSSSHNEPRPYKTPRT